MKKKREIFKVYFDQVNQTKYEVEAISVNQAHAKAERLWRQENGVPLAIIEDKDGNQVY